ncbi:MAG: TIGR00299 family protein [Ignavibacteria bacterium GWA2_55_11]|nr:MAG: TIGR00299 family protein [Ignavibacteria bacterium GWA2_55_11]OGU67845.1 MAG: TIGR00299 family protein [Ignavibacteria bacterium RIFCSPHIGHO2_02_FULL_56_12]OGU71281.1 MAG: TIGR00299 family protein [Ignavibacteria bacterium RIFCSPLOWO2_12_FULL_56_21]
MKIAYFDTFSGISGDMTLGACVSAGVLVDDLRREMTKLDLAGYEIEARHLVRNGMTAVKIDVVISDQPHYHRHLQDILDLIEASGLTARVKKDAQKIFHEIGVAEAKVHNTTLDKVHFHEVGAIDSLVDIVGAAICLEKLGVGAVYSSPVRLGSGGTVKTQHGVMPIPTPATVEILKGYPMVLTEIPEELTTPTGAGFIKALSSGVLSLERLRIEAIGYGAGTKEIPQIPNLLRVMVGELEPGYDHDELVTVETNIDDMNPEIFPFVIERLLSSGAHDAFLIPVLMKKGRPGTLLSVLTDRKNLESVLSIVFRETTTLGVRITPTERRKVKRDVRTVETSFGPTRVKVIVFDGTERIAPEFEECKRIALEHNLPLKDVYNTLERELHG